MHYAFKIIHSFIGLGFFVKDLKFLFTVRAYHISVYCYVLVSIAELSHLVGVGSGGLFGTFSGGI